MFSFTVTNQIVVTDSCITSQHKVLCYYNMLFSAQNVNALVKRVVSCVIHTMFNTTFIIARYWNILSFTMCAFSHFKYHWIKGFNQKDLQSVFGKCPENAHCWRRSTCVWGPPMCQQDRYWSPAGQEQKQEKYVIYLEEIHRERNTQPGKYLNCPYQYRLPGWNNSFTQRWNIFYPYIYTLFILKTSLIFLWPTHCWMEVNTDTGSHCWQNTVCLFLDSSSILLTILIL